MKNKYMIVFSERYVDGKVMKAHDARREYIRARACNEHADLVEIEGVEIDDYLIEVLNEMNIF